MSEKKQQSNKGVDKSRDALLSGARKRERPAHAFMSDSDNQNTEPKQVKENDSGNHINKQDHENITYNQNKETEQYSGTDNSINEQQKGNVNNNMNSEREPKTSIEDEKVGTNPQNNDDTLDESDDSFWNLIEQEKKKKTVEETHTRQTYLIRNDLLRELNKVSRKQGKGFKTKVINYALEQFLNDTKK